MPRERRDFDRITGIRDPSLIVIAMEGAETEPQYFNAVSKIADESKSRLKLKILPKRENTVSAAKYVLEQMNDYKKEFGIKKTDELCLVIDRDAQSLKEANLADVARLCADKQYLLALSNPCFELWLLLHHLDVSAESEAEKQSLLANKKQFAKNKLRQIMGSYNPANLNLDDFWPQTRVAIERANALDNSPKDRWPNDLGSRVYLIMDKVLNMLEL